MWHLFRDSGKSADAHSSYREAHRQAPDNPKKLSNLGDLLSQSGKIVVAEAALRLAVQSDPRYIEAYNNLRIAVARLERLEDAQAYFRQVIALQPSFAQAHTNSAGQQHLARARQTAGGQIHFEQALRLKPDRPHAHISLGFALTKQGKQRKFRSVSKRPWVLIRTIPRRLTAASPRAMRWSTSTNRWHSCASRFVSDRTLPKRIIFWPPVLEAMGNSD